MKGITISYEGFSKDFLSTDQLLSLFDKLWGESARRLPGFPEVIGRVNASWHDSDGKEHHVAHINELMSAYNDKLTYDIRINGSINKNPSCTLVYTPAHKKALFQVSALDDAAAQQHVAYVKDVFPIEQVPVIFISYADNEIALADFAKKIMEKLIKDPANIFVAKRDISSGEAGLKIIESKLKTAHAIIPICSHKARESPWVWWEAAAVWGRGNRVYPLFANISANGFGPPLALFAQGKSYFNTEEFTDTLKTICKDLNIGVNSTGFSAEEEKEYNRLKEKYAGYSILQRIKHYFLRLKQFSTNISP